MKLLEFLFASTFMFLLFSCNLLDKGQEGTQIKPYDKNPKYWQYKGKPILLLGATDSDNLFQMEGLEDHLNELASFGGNYIRNTMSYRDSGDVCPYSLNCDGKYDLNKWSEHYWNKFDSLLQLSSERDIIVQIEIWDRFDFSQQFWKKNPFNPENNINYSESAGIMEIDYPEHPGADAQPFFHSIPGMPLYYSKLDNIREFQEKYIDKLLSYTFKYGNVLYCMNNETSTPVEWGNYWIDYIREKAEKQKVEVYLTDMYDDFYKVNTCEECKNLIALPEYYSFMDISQINSRNFGQAHWDTLQVILQMRDQYELRPVNNTKIYGGGNYGFGSGSNEEGIERFCRNVIGGCASARHHRPPAGNGLNQKAKASLKATRKAEELVKLWEVSLRMDLLNEREPNEAYLTAKEGEKYLLYFPKGGAVKLDLKQSKGKFQLNWISISTGEWGNKTAIAGGEDIEIKTLTEEGWYAVITRK